MLARLKKFLPVLTMGFLASATCFAEQEVRVAFNNALAPYALEKTQNGIEVEIVREALQREGYKLVPVFGSAERKESLFGQKMVDGIATVNKKSLTKASLSDPYVSFQNVAITLKSRHLKINNLNDLEGLRISAFQGATFYLGDEFKRFADNSSQYSEEAQQLNQNRLLYSGAVDVIIMERNIFNYLTNVVEKSFAVQPLPAVDIHPIFAKTPYRVGFHNAKLRNKFNDGLKSLSDEDLETIYANNQEAIRFSP